MSARARTQILLLSTLLIVIMVIGAVGVVVFMPIHLSGTRQLAVLLVGGGSAGIGTASSEATVHYDDGTTENLSGTTITLIPVFQQASVAPSKVPLSADWAAQVLYIPNFDLSKYCKYKGIPLLENCAVDAILIIDTDIAITVDGQVVARSPDNGRISGFSSKGCIKDWVNAAGNPFGQARTFEPGATVTVFSLPNFDVTPYREADRSVTIALTGTQTLQIFPVYATGPGLGGCYTADFTVDWNENIIQPYEVNYSDPSFQIPPTTVTTPDYQLSASPSALTMSTNPANDGNRAYVRIGALAYNGLTGTFHVGAVEGAPTGVGMTFDTPNDQEVTASNSLVGVRLKFSTASNAKIGNYTFTIPTNIGSVSHSITLPVTINELIISCPAGANCPTIATVLTAQLSQTEVSAYFPFQVTGELTTTGGGAVPAASIYAQPTWGTGGQGATGNNGKFSITLTAPKDPGTYDIVVSFAGDSLYAAAEPITLRVSVRQVDWTTIIIIVAVIVVAIIIALGYAMSRRKPGMP